MASPEEMKELTRQFQNNTEDLQSYLRDLNTWEKEMNAKDEQLKKAKKDGMPSKNKKPLVEEVSTTTKRKVEEKKIVETKKPKEEKIKTHDYKKWDQFDVDKALEELDKDGDPEVREEDEKAVSEAQLRQQAIVEKDRGNDYFKQGKHDQAIECYTRGIQCDPTNAVLPANRAMALLKRSQWTSAEADCTVALALDPTYVKALLRRATARGKLGRDDEAAEDCERALQVEPKNKQAAAELERLKEKKRKSEEEKDKPPSEQVKTFESNIKAAFTKTQTAKKGTEKLEVEKTQVKLKPGQVLPVVKPLHKRSKKPMRRIEITEVGDVDMEQVQQTLLSPADREEPMAQQEPMAEEKQKEIVVEERLRTKSRGLQRQVEKEISRQLQETNLGENASSESPSTSAALPPKPTTSVQFLSAWKTLATSKRRADYLGRFGRKDYPVVFKHSLEPNVFSDVIAVLSSADLPVAPHMLGLADVPRVSTIVMFMGTKEKEAVKKLIERCKSEKCSQENINLLLKRFDVSL